MTVLHEELRWGIAWSWIKERGVHASAVEDAETQVSCQLSKCKCVGVDSTYCAESFSCGTKAVSAVEAWKKGAALDNYLTAFALVQTWENSWYIKGQRPTPNPPLCLTIVGCRNDEVGIPQPVVQLPVSDRVIDVLCDGLVTRSRYLVSEVEDHALGLVLTDIASRQYMSSKISLLQCISVDQPKTAYPAVSQLPRHLGTYCTNPDDYNNPGLKQRQIEMVSKRVKIVA